MILLNSQVNFRLKNYFAIGTDIIYDSEIKYFEQQRKKVTRLENCSNKLSVYSFVQLHTKYKIFKK